MEYVLELKNISKSFGGVKANDKVSLNLKKGEILALVGENGAGKSTLMSVLYGLLKPDEGEIYIKGKKMEMENPSAAIAAGVGMVFQHFMLVPTLTVAENVTLGAEPLRGGILNRKKMTTDVEKIAKEYGMKIDPEATVMDISLGMQQRVEIIKTLYRKAEILILDEPTAVLTPQEVDELFFTIKELTKQGLSVIFITHKLKEVLEISDRISVLRRGKIVGSVNSKETDQKELAKLMVGRDVVLKVEKEDVSAGAPFVSVKNVNVSPKAGLHPLKEISFDIRRGEILGIAGVDGNGQSELEQLLTGLLKPNSGTVTIDGKEISHLNAQQVKDTGITHVPEDRHKMGLVLDFSIPENLILGFHKKPPVSKKGVLDETYIKKHAKELIEKYDIRTLNEWVPARSLSGGNQQKIVIAREIDANPELLIAAHPTRGVDIGAIEFIHQKLLDLRSAQKGVLLISADLNEVMSLSDRIVVMFEGEIMGIVDAKDATETQLGLMMAGNKQTSERGTSA